MLYVFGDSFSYDIKHLSFSNHIRDTQIVNSKGIPLYPNMIPLEKNWTAVVSEKLTGSVEHVNDSMPGCANEYIFHNLMNRMSQFKDGDCVIVCLTSKIRRWLIERSPECANWQYTNMDHLDDVVMRKEEKIALSQYARYLYSDLAADAIYKAMFWAIVNAAQSVASSGVRFIIVPGFEPIPGVHGTLQNASQAEFDSEETDIAFRKKTNDTRWNHFTEVNHTVLADKVYEFFTENKPLDLTTGFESNIYTKNNI